MASAKNKTFDSVVVGGGLQGLLISYHLQKMGQRVALVEAREALGGTQKAIETKSGNLAGSLNFLPDTPEAEGGLEWLKGILPFDLSWERFEQAPLTFDGGELKTFVGFGDQSFASLDFLSCYNRSSHLRLSLSEEALVEEMARLFTGEVFTLSEVTGLTYENDKVISLTLNAAEELFAHQFIWAASPMRLKAFNEQLPDKFRQRLARNKSWSELVLSFIHKTPVSLQSPEGLHFLYGSTKEFEPCLGRFWPKNPDESQLSIWVTPIPEELTEDNEHLSGAIKYMKRQIKRAFPEGLDQLIMEKISVRTGVYGPVDLKLKDGLKVPGLSNFAISHALLSSKPGLVGSLEMLQNLFLQPPLEAPSENIQSVAPLA